MGTQLFTEFGEAPGDDFRIEGAIEFVQGPCAVLIISNSSIRVDQSFIEPIKDVTLGLGLKKILGFINAPISEVYEQSSDINQLAYSAFSNSGIEYKPQFLDDLAFNILVATTVYLEFRDKITWDLVNYLPSGLLKR